MNVPDHQIPEGMNFADYCDALRNEGYGRSAQLAKRAQNPQIPREINPQEKPRVDERPRAAP